MPTMNELLEQYGQQLTAANKKATTSPATRLSGVKVPEFEPLQQPRTHALPQTNDNIAPVNAISAEKQFSLGTMPRPAAYEQQSLTGVEPVAHKQQSLTGVEPVAGSLETYREPAFTEHKSSFELPMAMTYPLDTGAQRLQQ